MPIPSILYMNILMYTENVNDHRNLPIHNLSAVIIINPLPPYVLI